jgi:hypothetical protein
VLQIRRVASLSPRAAGDHGKTLGFEIWTLRKALDNLTEPEIVPMTRNR